jgi:hypothetical protein
MLLSIRDVRGHSCIADWEDCASKQWGPFQGTTPTFSWNVWSKSQQLVPRWNSSVIAWTNLFRVSCGRWSSSYRLTHFYCFNEKQAYVVVMSVCTSVTVLVFLGNLTDFYWTCYERHATRYHVRNLWFPTVINTNMVAVRHFITTVT